MKLSNDIDFDCRKKKMIFETEVKTANHWYRIVGQFSQNVSLTFSRISDKFLQKNLKKGNKLLGELIYRTGEYIHGM
jgi:hypothetical protein